ncbi:MAG: D-amino-acid oxidase [uncultured Solirubrobacteraceae bacterium]|uniref:D-amino-acid oxidase n=1 Tax=uncultured Solirubrobacteraceae bacterium TaxID=1162706 RepID=A0A6J4RC30_9ACTN|nr:MAG: D-amino-acid oxidase [uncultured Solirubrobacteraceae bacterium]
MTLPDVVVVGAGIVGASAAWELAGRGAQVTLVDAGEVSGGTTGLGEGNVLCSDKDAGPELELARLGLARYDAIEAELGEVARIRRKGALIVHPREDTWAAEPARAARLRAAGVEAELLDPEAVRAVEPGLTGALHGATRVPGDLQCDPRAIARALAAAAARLGARVRTHCRVEHVQVDGGRVAGVRLAGGEVLGAGAVVVAAGPWSRELCEDAGVPLPLEPRKGQLVQLALPAPDPDAIRHKVVDGSYLLSVVDPGSGLQLSSVVETTWEGHVVVGSSRERRGFDLTVDEAVGAAMVERAATLFPALAGLRRMRAWAGLRPWLPDHLPAIGPSERVAGLWVATGHEGAGVALGPITGLLVAQGLCGEPAAFDFAPLRPDRFARVAG